MSELTIAQALRFASKLKNQVSDARARAVSSLNHKKDDQTAFDFSEMLEKADSASYELASLHGKLAIVNATNTVQYKGNSISLSHAIRILQELKGRIAWVKALTVAATENYKVAETTWSETAEKYVNGSAEMVCHLPEAKRVALVDSLQDEFDSLNGAVEMINQTVKITV